MLDQDTPSDRIVSAALRLAEARGWRDLTLSEISAEAGVPLSDLRRTFKTKADILRDFTRAVDDEVMRRLAISSTDGPRDRLFDVVITRFEVLTPYKAALRRIHEDLRLRPGAAAMQLGAAARSQYWMLQAAGINPEGSLGLLRVKGLLAVYADVFSIWLEDDDPGMARTMAALDRRLRRGEDVVRRVERVCDGIENLVRSLKGHRTSAPRPAAGPAPETQPGPAPDMPGASPSQA